ncbi:hypothetical protein [Nocardioides currus]|uniref:Alpha/beta hydrolase n=1 Tax=Nocardioides currus TaxID=2133958 RepID=A0A2R7Z242_9ACTN|nr:hypothetical protein [Nocardioides currus]PUA82229.1 hypothetical protein C7S10_00230 [Nocardioides currus]
MNTTAFRRAGAIAGAAVFTIAMTSSTAPATAGTSDEGHDRPCFMIRSPWNNAEGPQPTCPTGRFETSEPAAARPVPVARIADFMP